jgi:hypothetical protein
MYALHDNGRKLFDNPRNSTPMARFVYIMAKNHHQDDPTDDPTPPPHHEARQATSKFR